MCMPGVVLRTVRTPRPAPPAHLLRHQRRMSWWSRLLGGQSKKRPSSRQVDYLSEAIALERQGDFDAAPTSYRLALRDRPNDPRILQNIAIAYSRTGLMEDAIRSYRRALEVAHPPPVVNIAGPETVSMRELVSLLGEALGRVPVVHVADGPFLNWAADIARQSAVLGPPKIGLREGLRREFGPDPPATR